MTDRSKTQRTPEFQAWFGDSKVVDSSGEPLRVFHGTASEFMEFDPKSVGRNYFYQHGRRGFFFTNRPILAEVYAENAAAPWLRKNAAPNIRPVYLRMERPYERKAPASPDQWFSWYCEKLFEKAAARGADGIILHGGKGFTGRLIYVAFEPTQIKSTFDPIAALMPSQQMQPVHCDSADAALHDLETSPCL